MSARETLAWAIAGGGVLVSVSHAWFFYKLVDITKELQQITLAAIERARAAEALRDAAARTQGGSQGRGA